MYMVPDLLEEIFLRLPLKSIFKFRTVSKQWRSILTSKRFEEKRKSLQKSHRKILAAHDCDCVERPRLLPQSQFEGDEEIVYLHWPWLSFFPEKWTMGFGRDKVTGKFKVVRMCSYFWGRNPVVVYGVLDVEIGEWRKLRPPPHVVNAGSKSVCVNGSIYWAQIDNGFRILALDLHKEKFRRVRVPPTLASRDTQIVNLEARLAIAITALLPEWVQDIWAMDIDGKSWSKIYSISLAHRVVSSQRQKRWFTPVSVSKERNLVFFDNQKRLFKYYPATNEIRCLSLDVCVISSYEENVVSLPLKPSHPQPYPCPVNPRVSKCRLLSRETSS